MSSTSANHGPFDGQRDLARAVGQLAERLPEPLLPLARLAYNYLWSWLPEGRGVFRDLDPTLWRRSCCNPRWLLEALPPSRFRELATDAALVSRVAVLAERLDAYLARPPASSISPERPVAYFCSEFALHCSLPLYGGGLGVLAGDVLKAASDGAVPMLGVGLLYRQGYFHQRLDLGGWQREFWTTTDFERLPLVRVLGADGEPISVEVRVRDRTVRVHVWRGDFGRVPLYLLDTDRDDNHPIDRWITARLYIADRQTRLAQYAILGVGGIRALGAMGVEPGLVHLNEGHAALSGLERLRVHRAAGASTDDALARVRESTVFTTHTPVAAGNESYSDQEVDTVLGSFLSELGDARGFACDLGRFRQPDGSEPFGITPLALRTSRAANGVSRRHGIVSRGMWQAIWPDRPAAEVPIGHVTNGVHTTTWMSSGMQALLDRHLDPGWRAQVADPATWEKLLAIPDGELWNVRRELRAALVEYVRAKSVYDRLDRGESADYVEAAASTFDPESLTLGIARRVATYKRLHLLTRQLDRGLRLLADRGRPIQVVIAGKAHPGDEEAKETLRALMAARRAPHVAAHIAFLEDYDLHMAPLIVAGCDVWLNLPRPPLEASGTSGMKVVLNGGLNLSVLDGWWEEACDPEVGWGIATPQADATTQDDHDAGATFDALENEIMPAFFERDAAGVPSRWVARIKASMSRLGPRFSAARMLAGYVSTLYDTGAPTRRSG